MNILAEVLSSVEETQMTNLKGKIPMIVSRINKLKVEVKNYMDNSHIDLKILQKKSNNMLDEVNKLNDEMNELNVQLQNVTRRDLDNISSEVKNLKQSYEESLYTLSLISQLVNIDALLENAKSYLHQKQYLKAIVCISDIKQILKQIPVEDRLDIIQAITISTTIEQKTILNETNKTWNESVEMNKKILEDQVDLSIKIHTIRLDELSQSIQALCYEKPFTFELQCLSNFLMNEIFASIINHNCKVVINHDSLYSILNIIVNKNLGKMSYDKVFCNIRSVIEFFVETINFEINENLLLLGFVGQKINEQFCELLIKNCLADTIPSTVEGLKMYDVVVNDIESLQGLFVDCQFFDKNNESILEYAKNIDVLFANKTCQLHLDRAKTILKKDLHDMLEVGSDSVANSSTVFEKCFVSKNVIEYLDLVRKILDQANTSSDMCAGRLVYTADQIIGLYYKIVPEYHKKLLNTIPQQVALFHNNCCYIAYELLTLNKYKHNEKANIILREQLFGSHSQLLRTTGTDLFSKYLKSQVAQIEEILKESELNNLGQVDKLDAVCEKSIRQCLRQLELLKTVWQKVLTYEIYNKTIGELLDSFVQLLIKLVIGVEDISSDNCTLLVEVYSIVKTRAPKLFSEPKEINLYVKHWYKFNELILLLNSNLTDINDRWVDGKGPLAVEFSADEVKGLIRALFQNSERRSAVLARIN